MTRVARLAVTAALLLSACATTGTPSGRSSDAVARLTALNAAAQRGVAVLTPWLSPERAERVRLAAALVDVAIARVAQARTAEEQAVAVGQAQTAIADYKWSAAQ